MSLLVARNLRKDYGGVRAVADISFAVEAGEMVALIGPNGAGKSTCFNLLNGQVLPDSGQVLLGGVDVTGWRPRDVWHLGVGRSFQIAATFASMTVRENVQVALLAVQGMVWRFLRPLAALGGDATEALLVQVGLKDRADLPCAALAYGDLKRLELALALANEPRLLLMDEPTAGMPQADRRALMALVHSLARLRNCAVLFTEHDMDVVFSAADRILVMDRGALIAEGDAAAIRANPQVQAVYLGEAVERDGAGPAPDAANPPDAPLDSPQSRN
ncbi:MAG: ABC transporter ATP-binding protein [Acetobacteraceae bacterium]